MKPLNLRNFYSGLALISSLAAVQTMIFPRWPEAPKLSEKQLNSFATGLATKGHILASLPILPYHRDYNLSHTPISGVEIDSKSELRFANFQVRDRKDLSVSRITESFKSLRLNQSASVSSQPPFFNSHTTAKGTNFQTCFVPGSPWPSGFNIGQDQLTLSVDKLGATDDSNLGIKRIMGLVPSRKYGCMLITLQTSLNVQEANKLWIQVLNQVQNSFD